MTYKGHSARVQFDAEDNIFVGRIAGINAVVGFHTDNVSDIVRSFHEAVDDYIAACQSAGKPVEKPNSGKLMLRVKPEVHAKPARAAELAGKSMNQWSEEVRFAAAAPATSK